MSKTVISTGDAPAAVGPYSQAIVSGNFVFVAGQVGLDPATRKLVEGDIQAHTHQTFKNIQAILEEAGSSLAQVVKATVFLADIDTFAAMNEAYAQYFGDAPPARSTVQVAALPLGAPIEIEVIAVRP